MYSMYDVLTIDAGVLCQGSVCVLCLMFSRSLFIIVYSWRTIFHTAEPNFLCKACYILARIQYRLLGPPH